MVSVPVHLPPASEAHLPDLYHVAFTKFLIQTRRISDSATPCVCCGTASLSRVCECCAREWAE